ncbi:MAG TPA: TonB-dependent receptor plug domain-containing protein, partial [Cyclobacteriaceae bacterium]|nr:TonB-dependent receptor plug domain-containing protein [Cyclobacteriaceae bacterium]
MRKTITTTLLWVTSCLFMYAQDSLKTTWLQEVVTTGTKFDVPVEKSGKTIFKLTSKELSQNAGKSLADLLNEVPGIQVDGNFGTPGTNVSYYVRGGRNRNTLILIDGVPLNDPSAINAEYDLRYIPVSQIESIEVLKGGLSTLYGTGAAAGVIDIRLKNPDNSPFKGSVDLSAASYHTFSQNLQVQGTTGKFSYLVMGNNTTSDGFSSAQDNDPNSEFDKDGFSRQNGLLKLGCRFSTKFKLNGFGAYEKFNADYDDYEFTDAPNKQEYNQYRIGLNPVYQYKKGELQAKVVYNVNERIFKSSFPSEYQGKNLQTEVTARHFFSNVLQGLVGLNYQHMAFDQKEAVSIDSAHIDMFDPYASLLIDLPAGLNVHAGLRLNTHSIYGSKVVYNFNPSYLINNKGEWRYKLLGSVSSSYITPSLYQLYSVYGNKDLSPEEAVNYEAGISVYAKNKFTFNFVWFKRNETNPIDFVSLFDDEGNYIGGKYVNLTSKRVVKGVEISMSYELNNKASLSLNYTHNDTDKPESFYRIPKDKFGAVFTLHPLPNSTLSLKYNNTGKRTTFDFTSFSEVTLESYQLVDIFASYGLLKKKLTLYGA